jgi:hypothetical protein
MKTYYEFRVTKVTTGEKQYSHDDDPCQRNVFSQQVDETYKGVCVKDLVNLINNPKCLVACRAAAEVEE